jgi:hypothetical protein
MSKFFLVKSQDGTIANAFAADSGGYSAADGTPALEYVDEASAIAANPDLAAWQSEQKTSEGFRILDAAYDAAIAAVQDAAGTWWSFATVHQVQLAHDALEAIRLGVDLAGQVYKDYYDEDVTITSNAYVQGIAGARLMRIIACNAAYDADVAAIKAGGSASAIFAVTMPPPKA